MVQIALLEEDTEAEQGRASRQRDVVQDVLQCVRAAETEGLGYLLLQEELSNRCSLLIDSSNNAVQCQGGQTMPVEESGNAGMRRDVCLPFNSL